MNWFKPSRRSRTTVTTLSSTENTEARDALVRAQKSKIDAIVSLTESRIMSNEIRHELRTNHFAADVWDSMRSRRR